MKYPYPPCKIKHCSGIGLTKVILPQGVEIPLRGSFDLDKTKEYIVTFYEDEAGRYAVLGEVEEAQVLS